MWRAALTVNGWPHQIQLENCGLKTDCVSIYERVAMLCHITNAFIQRKCFYTLYFFQRIDKIFVTLSVLISSYQYYDCALFYFNCLVVNPTVRKSFCWNWYVWMVSVNCYCCRVDTHAYTHTTRVLTDIFIVFKYLFPFKIM